MEKHHHERTFKKLAEEARIHGGIECAECEIEVQEAFDKRRWFKEPRIVFLGISGLLTVVGFVMRALGAPDMPTRVVFAVATVVGGYFPFQLGLAGLKKLSLNINTLLVTAAVGAVILNLWEEAAILVFVFSLGSVLETYAVDRARNSIGALVDLVPRRAVVIRDGQPVDTDVDDVKIGDVILVRPGDKIPLDGTVVTGTSSVDQAPITGEALPVVKRAGDAVYAGTINERGSLEVEVTRLASDTTLAKIIHSIEEHQARKSSYQRFGERFGKYYTPLMFGLALGVALLPPLILGGGFQAWFYRALVVLVVSCSCGIALSVPVAVVAAITNAARNGVLFKGGAYLEIGSQVKAVTFDKTGTLTVGRPTVTDILGVNGFTESCVLGLAASVETRSEHPLATAIIERAKAEGVPFIKPSDFHIVPGVGARAGLDGEVYHIGNRRLMEAHGVSLEPVEEIAARLERDGKTLVFLSEDNRLAGLIAVSDALRPQSAGAVAALKRMGIKTVMLTGDNAETARTVAAAAGIDDYRALLLPEDKVRAVDDIGQSYGLVAMVGDGVNDAPAMAAASVGIAMGAAGTDVAIETGDIALMADDLSKLPYIFDLSRRTVATIMFNITAALVIVAVLVPLALLGWVQLVPGLLINEFGAILIILNGLRLLR